MQLILITGLSGSGKSVALNVLEDSGYYYVDNLPAKLLPQTVDFLAAAGHPRVALSIELRSARGARRAAAAARRFPRAAATTCGCCSWRRRPTR